MVHRAAVETLSRIQEPPEFGDRIIVGLFQLVRAYRGNPDNEDFLLDCIELLSSYLRREGDLDPKVGGYLLTLLAEIDGQQLRRNLRWITRIFRDHEAVVNVVAKAMSSAHHLDHDWDDLMTAVEVLSDRVIKARKDEIVRLGVEMMVEHPLLGAQIIEVLWKIEAWGDAKAVATAGVERLPENARNQWRRTHAHFHRIAAAFEEAIAEGRLEEMEDLEGEWQRNVEVMRKLKADAKERNSRGLFPRPG
jgi:hypothetical protein